jgi:hypothetical protein
MTTNSRNLIYRIVVFSVMSCLLASCQHQATAVKPTSSSNGKDKILLTLDFKKDQTLRYKFTSSRDITVVWNDSNNASSTGGDATTKSSESLETVIAYTPVEINKYGLTTIKATCESAVVKRSDGTQSDAAKSFAGKSYNFTVGPSGKIEDYSQIDALIKQVGQGVFTSSSGGQQVKDPDMIGDYIASQWFMWDSIASIPKASEGLKIGQTWQSKLSVPTPMVSRLARDVKYMLDKITQSDSNKLALIISTYSKADSVPESWPVPYSGKFLVKGRFGILSNYKLLSLDGMGEELFNIDSGYTEQYSQQYHLKLQASMSMGISVNPLITIEQKLTMQILRDKTTATER